jgi:hypothetical protein
MEVTMKPLTHEQIQGVVSVIYKARTDKQVKLRFGLRQRQAMMDAIKNNKPDTSDYRYRWIAEVRNEIIRLLGSEADRFNAKYPHDSISVQDFIDVIDSTSILLKAANKSSALAKLSDDFIPHLVPSLKSPFCCLVHEFTGLNARVYPTTRAPMFGTGYPEGHDIPFDASAHVSLVDPDGGQERDS